MAKRKPAFGGFLDYKLPTDARGKLADSMERPGYIDQCIERLVDDGLKVSVWYDPDSSAYVLNMTMVEIPSRSKTWIVSTRASSVGRVIAIATYFWDIVAGREYWDGLAKEDKEDYW